MEEEEKDAPTPTLGGRTASATPSPRHIPSLTATKKGLPRDPEGAPNSKPTGARGSGPPREHGDCAGGRYSTTLRALHPPPQLGRGKGGGYRGTWTAGTLTT